MKPIGYHTGRRKLALALLDVGAVFLGKDPEAPLLFDLNLRTTDHQNPGPLTAPLVGLAAGCMRYVQLKQKITCDAVADVPQTGNPFAMAFAEFAGVPYIAMERHESGEGRCIMSLKGHSITPQIKNALVINDAILRADSSLGVIRALRGEDVGVTDVIVLINHQQGGSEGLDEWNCRLHSVFTVAELMNFFVEVGRATSELRDAILKYRYQPVPQLQD